MTKEECVEIIRGFANQLEFDDNINDDVKSCVVIVGDGKGRIIRLLNGARASINTTLDIVKYENLGIGK